MNGTKARKAFDIKVVLLQPANIAAKLYLIANLNVINLLPAVHPVVLHFFI